MPDFLVLVEIPAYQWLRVNEKLALMSIHTQIKARRDALGWSQTKLAVAVSKSEGLKKPLTYSTVQQWEKEGGTAPKRVRLRHVAASLGCTVEDLISEDLPSTPATSEPRTAQPWPFKTIAPAQLAALPESALLQIEQILATFTMTPLPVIPDWRQTAREIAAASDKGLGTELFTPFVETIIARQAIAAAAEQRAAAALAPANHPNSSTGTPA